MRYLAAILCCCSLFAHAEAEPIPGSICAVQLKQIRVLTSWFDTLQVYEIVAVQYGLKPGDRIKDELTAYRVLHSQSLIATDILKCMIDSMEMEAS